MNKMERCGKGAVVLYMVLIMHGAGGVGAGADEESPKQQPYRTAFHFQPHRNWMNDPNGPMYYKGVYHLFYQYNPYAARWGNITWAHSVSYNLIDWIHLNHAIEPSQPYDIQGCWSGSVTILPLDDKPVILYTGVTSAGQQVQNLAMPKNLSDPFLTEWEKSPYNPLMTPDGIDPHSFRDPTTAWQGSSNNTWRVVIGSQINGHGSAILYKSDDFLTWRRADNLLHSSNKTGMWECPDFYPVGINSRNGLDTTTIGVDVRHVLKASFNNHDYYIIGTYDIKTDGFDVRVDFMDDKVQLRYDYGVFYASKTFYDGAKKRRILWGWVTEADTVVANDINRGWSGLQSIPRSVLLDKTGKQLIQWPIEEVEKLRGKNVTILNKELKSNTVFEVKGIAASQADVELSYHLPDLEDVELIEDHTNLQNPQVLCSRMNASVSGKFGPFGLLVLASGNLTEQTAVFFRIFKSQGGEYVVLMCSDQSRSSVKTPVKDPFFGAFVDIDPSQKIYLRTLIDHSIVESFGGQGKTCITARVYPELATAENSHIYAFNNGAKSVTISTLTGWSMKKALIAEVHRRGKPSFN